MQDHSFWIGKKVFITGHTGFKGTWLSQWLATLGATVIGYSLDPPSIPNLFDITDTSEDCLSCHGDINDFEQLVQTMKYYQPHIIFHMAAQPLVRKSYQSPIETFRTNVLGTVHVFEAARQTNSVKVIVNVTSDKCYENNKSKKIFQEEDRIGGHDPYSASKGCAELVTTSYRSSFFHNELKSCAKLASARAGNVIGGGDWAVDRLFPDVMRAFLERKKLIIRNRNAIRPWQHVLEPLSGYLLLAQKLWEDSSYCGAWNFGPTLNKEYTAHDVIQIAMQLWDRKVDIIYDSDLNPYEAEHLRLDSSKAVQKLGWVPKLSTWEAIDWTVQWYKNFELGTNMKTFTVNQIKSYEILKGV